MSIFAFDLETFLIQPGKHVPKGVCVSWAQGDYPDTPTGSSADVEDPSVSISLAHLNPSLGEREKAREILSRGLEQTVITGANVAFDMAVISQEFPELWQKVWDAYRGHRVFDVEVNEKLINIGKGHLKFRMNPPAEDSLEVTYTKVGYSLADIARDRLGIELEKDLWRLRYGTLYDTPTAQWDDGAREYSLLDAAVTYEIQKDQLDKDRRYLRDASHQARAAWWIHLMACHGFRVDLVAVKALEEHLRNDLSKLSALLQSYTLVKPNGSRDTKAAAARMQQVHADPPKTPTGKIKLSEDICLETGDPILVAYAEYTSLMGILRKDVAALKEAGEAGMPVQSRFDPLKETGRTGSSGGKRKKGQDLTAYAFQLQNVRRDPKPLPDGSYPPTVRGCFVPRDGFYLCSIDYGQMELHSWAQVCLDLLKFSDLATLLNAGVDVHCKLGAMIIGKTYEEVYQGRKTVQWAKDARQLAKCFHPDTEVLTRTGWVKISELSMGTEVAAAKVGDGGSVEILWEQPTRLTRNFAEELVHLQNKGIDLRVTPDHRMVGWGSDQRGAKAKRKRGESVPAVLGKKYSCTPEELPKARAWPSAGSCHSGVALEEERLLRLAVATQADGSYQGPKIRFGFYKQRKIDRLKTLLHSYEYDLLLYKNGKNRPVTTFRLHEEISAQIRMFLDEKKCFPWWWVNLSEKDRLIVLDEVQYWDSHVNSHARQIQYCSTIKQNVEVLQAIASITGMKTRAVCEPKESPASDCWKLSVKDHHITRGGALKPKRIPHHGDVYCLTVPSDAVLVRDGGIPVITHQCANFGAPGGLGAQRFLSYAKGSWGVEISLAQAVELLSAWRKMLSEAEPYFEWINKCTGDGSNYEIKQVRSNRIRGDVGFSDGANGYFQALAADCAKDSGFYLAEACYALPDSPLFGSRIVNFVHDEFIFEVPIARAHEAAFEANRIMEAAGKKWMPDCPPKSEPALMLRWWKDAEARYENGRLVPWKPKNEYRTPGAV